MIVFTLHIAHTMIPAVIDWSSDQALLNIGCSVLSKKSQQLKLSHYLRMPQAFQPQTEINEYHLHSSKSKKLFYDAPKPFNKKYLMKFKLTNERGFSSLRVSSIKQLTTHHRGWKDVYNQLFASDCWRDINYPWLCNQLTHPWLRGNILKPEEIHNVHVSHWIPWKS